jgi:hypothetical protein
MKAETLQKLQSHFDTLKDNLLKTGQRRQHTTTAEGVRQLPVAVEGWIRNHRPDLINA